jgi:multiple sugar transport system ATP-binding protein
MRLQTTMIYVTHDQTEAMTMGDRIAVMKDGVIQQVDDPISIYDKPVNKFVASFIGTPPMNFMGGKIVKQDSKLYFDEGNVRARLVKDMEPKLSSYIGKEVIFGIRSEDVYDKLFVSEAPAENIVRATCEVVEPMGSEVYLYLNTGKHTFVARVGAHDRPAINQDVDLVFDMSKAHFFDAQTEVTIV